MSVTAAGLAYERAVGRSPAAQRLLLLHAGVADRRMWDPQWQALTDLDRTRLDLRGFGKSTGAPAGGRFSHAEDVVAAMAELGLHGVHLVGSSFGAGVAVEVALLAPERVASLLLCPPGGSLLAVLTDDLEEFFGRESEALAAGDVTAAVDANVDTWLVSRARRREDVDSDLIELVSRMQRDAFAAAETLGGVDADELEPPATERLSEIAVPTLVVVGDLDLDTVQEAADRVAAGIAGAAQQRWSGVAHLPSLEEPERFTRLLREWVDQHPS